MCKMLKSIKMMCPCKIKILGKTYNYKILYI